MKRLLCALLVLVPAFSRADEGMYPVSEIGRLNLRAKGILLAAKDLYNPKGASLIDAVVDVGPCSGSFVSSRGLIITNHHCAFDALASASTPERDLVTNGFLARRLEEEIPARGSFVRIIDSYRDVSGEILGTLSDTLTPGERTRTISHRMRELVARVEREKPGCRAEVAEMFPGKSYVLFTYLYLRDVRLVYAPPRSIGEFGGEEDNWVWPRHTGDFSFLRAYVAPDGSPADYSVKNVPYKPKKFLKVQPRGVDEEDAVFILGYPGRTYRHRTAEFLAYEEFCRMPYVADLYSWAIATMEEAGRSDRAVALKFDARMKTLANTMKNYRGKLLGLGRLGLVEKRRAEEKALQDYIDADRSRRAKYGGVLGQIDSVYRVMERYSQSELALDMLRTFSVPLGAALIVADAAVERAKPDLERRSEFMEKNFSRTKDYLALSLANYHPPTDRTFLRELLLRALRLRGENRLRALDTLVRGADTLAALDGNLERLYGESRMTDSSFVMAALESPALASADPFMRLARLIRPAYEDLRSEREAREGVLSRNYALLLEVKQQYLKTAFLPDANSTLRFTCGRIRGYSPADAIRYAPLTTVEGVVEKAARGGPYQAPAKLLELIRKKDFGPYVHPRLRSVPLALLYNLDTTGGNSGSPLLNARGELVGVNFDRAYEATINDYAWSEKYSRSIGVDIRYILWVCEKVSGSSRLLAEMGL